MKIVFLSNFFNHHQRFISDHLYQATSGEYLFVETGRMPVERERLGYPNDKAAYVVQYNDRTKHRIDAEVLLADAVIWGEAPLSMIRERVKKGLITFRYSERRYKSPIKYLKWPIYSFHSMVYNRCFLLCAGAFCARDYVLSGMSLKRCFKWGYFPEFISYQNIDALVNKGSVAPPSILWVGRLIGIKHPEMAVEVGKFLKDRGYDFRISIVGCGELENELRLLIKQYSLSDKIELLGSMSPQKVRAKMEQSDIFLFTSDFGEGWGAVLNEAMNSGCAVVASHAAGSVPYMITDGINGFIYRSGSRRAFFEKVEWLISHPVERAEIAKNAYLTIKNTWNSQVACLNLLRLIEDLKNGQPTSVLEGPCSMAGYYKKNWFD